MLVKSIAGFLERTRQNEQAPGLGEQVDELPRAPLDRGLLAQELIRLELDRRAQRHRVAEPRGRAGMVRADAQRST